MLLQDAQHCYVVLTWTADEDRYCITQLYSRPGFKQKRSFKSCKWSYPSPAVVAPDYYAAAGSGVNILSATLGNFVVDDRLKDGGIRLPS
jgi:hypothetical protein